MEEILKCPVCQDLFTDPVSLDCRHNFCLSCINTVWDNEGSEAGPYFCPECQILLPSKPNLEINAYLQDKVKDLANSEERTTNSPAIYCDHCIESPSVAVRTCLTCDASLCQAHSLLHEQRSALKQHTLVEVTRDPLSLKCQEHRDELKLFCSQDRVPVCCLCVLVGKHKNHKAPQLHEACDDFKTMLESSMHQLLKRKNDAENTIKELESLYRQTVKCAADLRERISDKYSRLHVVLDGDERLMKQIVDAEEACVTEWLDAQRETMEQEIQDIDQLRASTKTLLHEDNHLRFLQQITAQSLCDPLDLPPLQTVDQSLCEPEKLRTVERMVDDLSMSLSQYFPRTWSYLSSPALDFKTAHPKLEISQDKRQVCWREQPPIVITNSSRPYDSQYSVLAEESFTKGRHYWEVIVQDKPYWLIGATTEPTPKNNGFTSNSNIGLDKSSWCIYHADGQYLACHDTEEKPLSVENRVKKLGIFADLHKGELLFYDANAMSLIHSFTVQCKEPMYPMFNPCIDVNGLNKQPLTLFWIKEPWDCKARGETRRWDPGPMCCQSLSQPGPTHCQGRGCRSLLCPSLPAYVSM
ncbi:E3 ubiquitin-protein ligase TRIM62-like [Boleophthalmus pectinirostris]|uniref:E3 ubiquitin-protein ligase TRIM62-like n=1 Tax=Boleophthalmus pectinirostris TaxID=150288 RepID=UPI00242A7AB8|nr:E3 ubiquitin-protein ligase TRIM62-like [Boleophthalmus pectinirostris]